MAKRGKNKVNQEISISAYPSVHWAKFFDKFAAVDIVPIGDWDTILLIAYFCKKYKTHYGTDYTFKFNSTAPTKSYEVYQFRKLSSMLSDNATILKDYIDWFFTEKIVARKRRITSMSFLTDANVVNEYKFKKLLMGKQVSIDRSTVIPPNYSAIIQKFGFNFTNYGELAFLKRAIDSGNGSESHKEMLVELSKSGLDVSVLDRVK